MIPDNIKEEIEIKEKLDKELVFPLDTCPRCKSIFTGTWDSLGAHITYCDCTSGYGSDFDQAKQSWIANYRYKTLKAYEKSLEGEK